MARKMLPDVSGSNLSDSDSFSLPPSADSDPQTVLRNREDSSSDELSTSYAHYQSIEEKYRVDPRYLNSRVSYSCQHNYKSGRRVVLYALCEAFSQGHCQVHTCHWQSAQAW